MSDSIRKLAETAAREDAEVAITIARESDTSVAFITGNSYFPPLRAFGHAESFYQADSYAADMAHPWEIYVEVFEDILENENVYLGCPDYDNALYVVDLRRWEYILRDEGYADGGTPYTDEDFPTLDSEWRKL